MMDALEINKRFSCIQVMNYEVLLFQLSCPLYDLSNSIPLYPPLFNTRLNTYPLTTLALKATSAGNLKLAQNILFFGATSLTSVTLTLPSSSTLPPSIALISYPNSLLIRSAISRPSRILSSDLVLKQCTWMSGSLVGVCGVKREGEEV
jgi:hypothetical protein